MSVYFSYEKIYKETELITK